MVTVADGTGAPVLSVATPVSVALVCAAAGSARNRTSAAAARPILERHILIVFHHLGRRRLAARARRRVSAASAAAALIPAAGEQLHRAGHDLGAVLFLSRFLVVPAVGADRAFDVDELSLAQILAANLAQFSPGGDVVPLGAFLFFAGAIGELLVGGDGEFGDRGAVRRGADLGILAEAADQNDFVDPGRFSLHAYAEFCVDTRSRVVSNILPGGAAMPTFFYAP